MEWSEIKQNLKYGDARAVAMLLDIPTATVYSTIQRESGRKDDEIRKALAVLVATRKKAEKEFNQLLKSI